MTGRRPPRRSVAQVATHSLDVWNPLPSAWAPTYPVFRLLQNQQRKKLSEKGVGGMTDALLSDYVSLGLLGEPAAAAAAAPAPEKPARGGSSRPEPLERVPWLASLKGIRSPLLRLHQGGAGTGHRGRGSPPLLQSLHLLAPCPCPLAHADLLCWALQRLWSCAATWRRGERSRRRGRRPSTASRQSLRPSGLRPRWRCLAPLPPVRRHLDACTAHCARTPHAACALVAGGREGLRAAGALLHALPPSPACTTHKQCPAPTRVRARPQPFCCACTAGLYLPTSDIDAVVMGSGCTNIPQGLKALATALARKDLAKNMQVQAEQVLHTLWSVGLARLDVVGATRGAVASTAGHVGCTCTPFITRACRHASATTLLHSPSATPPLLPPLHPQVIAKAKVPIVKFEEAGSGYAFDISFDVANGPEARGLGLGVAGPADCFIVEAPLALSLTPTSSGA